MKEQKCQGRPVSRRRVTATRDFLGKGVRPTMRSCAKTSAAALKLDTWLVALYKIMGDSTKFRGNMRLFLFSLPHLQRSQGMKTSQARKIN